MRSSGVLSTLRAVVSFVWLRCDIDVSVARFALRSKDESVGRALGLSVRTVRRTIGSLSVRLDAGSRFELGVRAALGGLV